jgi:hypothetical protein
MEIYKILGLVKYHILHILPPFLYNMLLVKSRNLARGCTRWFLDAMKTLALRKRFLKIGLSESIYGVSCKSCSCPWNIYYCALSFHFVLNMEFKLWTVLVLEWKACNLTITFEKVGQLVLANNTQNELKKAVTWWCLFYILNFGCNVNWQLCSKSNVVKRPGTIASLKGITYSSACVVLERAKLVSYR